MYVCDAPASAAWTPGTARNSATIANAAAIATRRDARNLVMVHPSSCSSGDRLSGGDRLDQREGLTLRANREVASERASRGFDGWIELHGLVLVEERDPERVI